MDKHYYFGSKLKLNELPQDGIEQVQLLKTGEFLHPHAPGGKFKVTSDTLRRLKENFENNVRRLDGGELAIDYGHNSEGEAAGWIKALELREDDTELWIHTEWTGPGRERILNKEYRFISADLDFGYVDNESGYEFGAVLLGAGLVNRPHIKDMRIIFQEEEINDNQGANMPMSPEEMMKKIGELEAMVSSLKAQVQSAQGGLEEKEDEVKEMGNKFEASEKEVKTLTEKVDALQKEKEDVQKEAKFNELLGKGAVVPSQKATFMEMSLELSEKFYKDAKTLNLSDKGNSGNNEEGNTDNDEVDGDAEEKIFTLAEAKVRESDKSITLSEAIKKVMNENPELEKEYNAKFA